MGAKWNASLKAVAREGRDPNRPIADLVSVLRTLRSGSSSLSFCVKGKGKKSVSKYLSSGTQPQAFRDVTAFKRSKVKRIVGPGVSNERARALVSSRS